MAIRIQGNDIYLGVRDLISADVQRGIISSFPLPQRGALGQQAQLRVQRGKVERHGIFHREYFLRRTYSFREYRFHIQGRIDGVYQLPERVEIEEIKSVIMRPGEFRRLDIEKYPHFLEQLFFYAYILQDELEGIEVITYLVLINLSNDKQRVFQVTYNRAAIESLLLRRFSDLAAKIERERKEAQRRASQIEGISFGLKEHRPQQQKMMSVWREALEQGKFLLVSAPTGTGKTAAAIYPALRFAYGRQKKIFFVTAKNTQHQLAMDTVKPLIDQGLDLKVLELRASRKMCLNEVYFCHEAFCPFIKSYGQRLLKSNILSDLLEHKIITPELITERAMAHRLCPFEVSLDCLPHCDVIVGDYNYVFDPAAQLRRLFAGKDYADWILIVDEAHNLYERGMAYLSPEIRRVWIRDLLNRIGSEKARIFREMRTALSEMESLLHERQLEGELRYEGRQYFTCDLNTHAWEEVFHHYESVFVRYLMQKINKQEWIIDDPIENFYYQLRRFLHVARLRDRAFVPYFDAMNGGILRIQCCDPSAYLGGIFDRFYSALAMSATLDPISFYQQMLGLHPDRTLKLELDSPFASERRKLIIVPGVSTRYADRQKSAPRIAAIIRDVVKLKQGNYLVFFPSYEYLQLVNLFLATIPGEKILQRPGMSEEERDRILNQLKNEPGTHLILAVMGGIFSEGVDYSGDMAVGVFVVGPALPKVEFARELLRQYYDERSRAGHQYAYVYPGMNKVIQAAGRLIRTHSDRGIIVLIGKRFAEEEFNRLLPDYWFRHSGDVVITDDFIPEIRAFWQRKNNSLGRE